MTSTVLFYQNKENLHLFQSLSNMRASHKKIVLATGVFDLLHEEHQSYLEKAKASGDVLVVAIESDARVRQLKGEGRPIEPQNVRLTHIQALPFVDFAFILPEDFSQPEHHEELIAHIRPNIYACSSHSPFQEKKQTLVEKYGGKLLVVHRHNPEISTTKHLKNIEK